MATVHPPKVFISYSHDSQAHADSVLALADRLRRDGVDAEIDQYEVAPTEGWPRWMRNRIKGADFVLVICTEPYRGRAEGAEKGGANREGLTIDQDIYESGGKNDKFIAVVLRPEDRKHIPDFLRPYQWESIETVYGYEKLYRRLTDQPEIVKPKIGKLRSLPARERRTPLGAGDIISIDDLGPPTTGNWITRLGGDRTSIFIMGSTLVLLIVLVWFTSPKIRVVVSVGGQPPSRPLKAYLERFPDNSEVTDNQGEATIRLWFWQRLNAFERICVTYPSPIKPTCDYDDTNQSMVVAIP